VTAYAAPGGRLADGAGIDIILGGDWAAMVVLGHDSTVPATVEEMLVLTRAVTRGATRPLVVADMPFGSFQVSDESALANAIRFVKEAGADAVKLEGAGSTLPRVRSLVDAGIPVMGHIGLTPQSATSLGGFKAQGRTAEKARQLFTDALALQAARCFSIVIEAVPAPVATRITEALEVPTIGIGAGAGCDGQVLVWHDLLGLYEGQAPRFVKRYADVRSEEHTSELQSPDHLVCRLLLEKKNKNRRRHITIRLTISNLKLLRRITRTETIIPRKETRRQAPIQTIVPGHTDVNTVTSNVQT